jgi:rubrerythrin
MDISNYSMDELLLSALKSEVEARKVYLKLAEGVQNFFLKDKLKFLAEEEEKHRLFFEGLFKRKLPGKEIVLPDKTPVPLPDLRIEDEHTPISEIFVKAMEAEKAAQDFYLSLSEKFDDDKEVQKTLIYIANMEKGHFKLFELEKDNALRFEDFDQNWPMMHAGP